MKDFKDYIREIVDGRDLSPEDARNAMHLIMSGDIPEPQIAAFLVGLRMKGETPDEIASMAKVMREFAEKIRPKVSGRLVDTCGTGGDKLKTFNVSTVAMFAIAGAGIPVAKHGNRSVTSKCGSADVLEHLGIRIDLEPRKVEECIEKTGAGFMFAPVFHKAMKHVMPARKSVGVRTVFNILGPLTNPADARGQVIGVYSEGLTEKVAEVLKIVGLERAFVVHGVDGLDEFSTLGRTKVSELSEDGGVETYYVNPEDYGLRKASLSDLAGGDAAFNAKILEDILSGSESGPKRDIVLLNSAAGMMVGGKADTLEEGLAIAVESIESGKARKKLESMQEFCKKQV